MRRIIVVLVVAAVLPAAVALAEPGDPVTDFGSDGVVTIPPQSYPYVGPGELVVATDGSIVFDVGDGDVDFGGAVARIDSTGSWAYIDGAYGTCASERAALGPDGSVFFGGDCENGTFLIRFTPELTLDTEWGDAATPGAVWDQEWGAKPLLSVDESRIAHVIGEGLDADPVLFVRDYDSGALLGEVALDPPNPSEARWLLALFPGTNDDYLTVAVVQATSIAVIASTLGEGSTLIDATGVPATIMDADARLLRSGDLLVAYSVAAGPNGDEIHLMRIGGDGLRDETLTNPALAMPMTDTRIAAAELRTGDLAVLTTDGTTTRIDRFSPDGTHRDTLAGFTDSPSITSTWIDLAVHPHDGSLLYLRDVRDGDGSFAEIHRFEGDRLGRFVDDEHTVFIDAIEWLAAEGITRGCNPPRNDNYCPDDPVTRGQMAAFINRAFTLPDAPPGNTFTDDDGSIFEEEIEKLAAAGITRGCNPPDNDRYCPYDPVTRGQMAAFLVRTLGLTDQGSIEFVDDDGSVFEVDIERLGTAGITRGCNPPDNDRYCPHDPVTRGQMAAFLARANGR